MEYFGGSELRRRTELHGGDDTAATTTFDRMQAAGRLEAGWRQAGGRLEGRLEAACRQAGGSLQAGWRQPAGMKLEIEKSIKKQDMTVKGGGENYKHKTG